MSQISNEPIGSKENPFICNSEQELLSLPPKTYCKYFVCKCTICGQTSQPKQIRNRQVTDRTFLCRKCSINKSCLNMRIKFQQEYGLDNPGQMADHKQKIVKSQEKRNLEDSEGEHIRRINAAKKALDTKRKNGYKLGDILEEKYGVRSTFLLESTKQTIINNYGSTLEMNKLNSEKSKATKLRKYGNANYVNLDKIKKTNFERYGVEFFCIKEECYAKKRYFYDNIYFDSSWELAFYFYLKFNNISFLYHQTKIEYYIGDKKHLYFPDFEVNGTLYEIKGDQFFMSDGTMFNPSNPKKNYVALEKQKLMKTLGVIIISKQEIKKYLDFCKEHHFNVRSFKV